MLQSDKINLNNIIKLIYIFPYFRNFQQSSWLQIESPIGLQNISCGLSHLNLHGMSQSLHLAGYLHSFSKDGEVWYLAPYHPSNSWATVHS